MKNKKETLEERVKRIHKKILSESPNADAQIRIAKSIKTLCDTMINGKIVSSFFLEKLNGELKAFKQTIK